MKNVLISVSDKTAILELAATLSRSGYRIISTGGTARYLQENGIDNIAVEEITNFPEILDGRVKTLHPKIMGAILAEHDNQKHLNELKELSISKIEMVIVNLYPFDKLYSQQGITHQDMIENIDIGGVTLLRAAAKNYHSVTVVSQVSDYSSIQDYVEKEADIPEDYRLELAVKAFRLTTVYDSLISRYLHRAGDNRGKNMNIILPGWSKSVLRYGENPHQEGYLYTSQQNGIVKVLHGKELSYNNYLDIDASLKLIMKFDYPAVAIIKHTNPCGVACNENLTTAYQDAFSTDTQSPFGGIVVMNKSVDISTAEEINKIFTEIIVAPGFDDDALTLLTKKKMRRLVLYYSDKLQSIMTSYVYMSCLDGILCQTIDYGFDKPASWQTVTSKQPDSSQMKDLHFAWKVVSALKSNAICLAHKQKTTGLGMGQTSRIDSMDLAIRRAGNFGHNLQNSVCASDGFFPFRDSIDRLSNVGIKAIIQPGGSKGDKEVIDACNEYGIAMVFTGMRHFNH